MPNFQLQIADWYRQNKRDLPWRNTNKPYFVWLSEIILQQTRVNQGMEYYLKFISEFPEIKNLADADEQKILKLWQGLGYYSRARNLHHAAKQIVNEFDGRFPNSYSEILKLKGVGEYTAAAIASFAFGLPHAVVDGNVYRVLSRYFDIDLPIDSGEGRKYFAALAQSLISELNPGLHNQAMMEFGALLCTPVNPACENCPVADACLARQNDTIKLRPVKTGKTKIRKRYLHYLLFREGENIIIEKRTEKDVWQNMFQLPLIESETESVSDAAALIKKQYAIEPAIFDKEYTHILSHQKILARFYFCDELPASLNSNQQKIERKELENYPLPRLIDRFFEDQEIYR